MSSAVSPLPKFSLIETSYIQYNHVQSRDNYFIRRLNAMYDTGDVQSHGVGGHGEYCQWRCCHRAKSTGVDGLFPTPTSLHPHVRQCHEAASSSSTRLSVHTPAGGPSTVPDSGCRAISLSITFVIIKFTKTMYIAFKYRQDRYFLIHPRYAILDLFGITKN